MEIQYIGDKDGNVISAIIPIEMWYKILERHTDVQNIIDGTEPESEEPAPVTLADFLTSEEYFYRTVGQMKFIVQYQKWNLIQLMQLEKELLDKLNTKEYKPDVEYFISTILKLTQAQIGIVAERSN